MAKRESNKPAAKAAKPAAVSTALPTSNESAQPGAGQGMAIPLSPEVLIVPPGETPPGVSGVFPPVAPLSEIVVGSEAIRAEDEQQDGAPDLDFLTEQEPAKFDEEHPAIALAQSFQTGSGVPSEGPVKFHLPQPPDVRRKAKG